MSGRNETSFKRRLGAAIVQLRKLRGFTQERLAAELERSEPTVSRWELGKSQPNAYDLQRLCEILECPADLLVFPPERPVSPIAQLLEERAAEAAHKGLATNAPKQGAA